MKIAMVFIPQRRVKQSVGLDSQPVQAVYLLGSILKNAGFEVEVTDPYDLDNIDLREEELILEKVVSTADVILFSSNSFNWATTSKIAWIIHRRCPNIIMITGGIHPSIFDTYILNNTPIDIVIRGEGERLVPMVLKGLERDGFKGLSSLEGITYRDEHNQIVKKADALPLSDEEYNCYNSISPFDTLPSGIYGGLPCETSRGCLYNCIFCGIGLHKTWKSLTIENVFKKIDSTLNILDEKCPGGFITITDDCFTTDKTRASQVLNYINRQPREFKIVLEGRLNEIQDKVLLKSIDTQRIRRFLVGIECGYNEGLKLVRKGYTTEVIENYLSNLKKCGLNNFLYCSFIIGLPWETEAECIQTIQFAAKIMIKYNVQSNISIWSIIPSELWDRRQEYGIKLEENFFDNPDWFMIGSNPENIKAIYPRITVNGFEKILRLLNMYKSRGINLIGN